MKRIITEFLRRGLVSIGIGPIILAVLYMILQGQGLLQTLTVNQVCVGIFSLSALAFVAGGMNVIYQSEHLPLMVAVLIHGFVLYISYLVTYLINDWIEKDFTPIFVFTGIFIGGYIIIWLIIYSVTKYNTDRLNKILQKKQQAEDSPY